MIRTSRIAGFAALAVLAGGFVADMSEARTAAPARGPTTRPATAKVKIVLAGDSTVTDGAGWGRAFARLLKSDATCVNLAVGGRSSKSYRDEGWWRKVLAEKPDYVLIQFGHNDVPGKGPKRETDPKTTFRENLARYVEEARAAGIKPVLVTSMTRRVFGPDDKIHSDLAEYADATKRVAAKKHVPLIDLHARSIELLNKLGPKASAEFDPAPKRQTAKAAPDKTHLSPKGAAAMGRIVANELRRVVPGLAEYVQ